MATIGLEQSLGHLSRGAGWLLRATGAVTRGSVRFFAVALAVVLIALPLYWVRDLFSRDVSQVPVILALKGYAPAPRPGQTPGRAPVARPDPEIPAPQDAAAVVGDVTPRETGAVTRSPRPQARPDVTDERPPATGTDQPRQDDWTAITPDPNLQGARA